jgi:hypothetical protein
LIGDGSGDEVDTEKLSVILKPSFNQGCGSLQLPSLALTVDIVIMKVGGQRESQIVRCYLLKADAYGSMRDV